MFCGNHDLSLKIEKIDVGVEVEVESLAQVGEASGWREKRAKEKEGKKKWFLQSGDDVETMGGPITNMLIWLGVLEIYICQSI